MLHYFQRAFGRERMPFDAPLAGRVAWAKFVGLVFFFSDRGDCADGVRTLGEQRRGLLAAYPLFAALHDHAQHAAQIQMLVDLKTQVPPRPPPARQPFVADYCAAGQRPRRRVEERARRVRAAGRGC